MDSKEKIKTEPGVEQSLGAAVSAEMTYERAADHDLGEPKIKIEGSKLDPNAQAYVQRAYEDRAFLFGEEEETKEDPSSRQAQRAGAPRTPAKKTRKPRKKAQVQMKVEPQADPEPTLQVRDPARGARSSSSDSSLGPYQFDAFHAALDDVEFGSPSSSFAALADRERPDYLPKLSTTIPIPPAEMVQHYATNLCQLLSRSPLFTPLKVRRADVLWGPITAPRWEVIQGSKTLMMTSIVHMLLASG